MSKAVSYWIAQVLGWGTLITLGLIFQKGEIRSEFVLEAALFFLSGIVITHFYRGIIIKWNWLTLKLIKLIPVVLIASILLSVLFFSTDFMMDYLLGRRPVILKNFGDLIFQILSYAAYFLFWSIIYFGYHLFEKSREQEIRNIQLRATKNVAELQNLRTQLNPHFMFNAMNSIRALVDENPEKAKVGITKLSNLLRSTLIAGKKDLLPFEDELDIVKDYLDLEKIRFEERLNFSFDIEPELLKRNFPPLLLQTIVENAVKHGISSLSKGGRVFISANMVENNMIIRVLNSGKYNPDKRSKSTAIGIENSIKRLQIMFGDQAHLKIGNHAGEVRTTITLPLNE
ncbi:histidine kinase [Flavobacteriales bacterium]|nr:histidine kinase [Flavobacteriales bacterium]